MEWTKIKAKHFLFSDYELHHKGCLVTLLCLTAHLERLPTAKEMVKITHYKSLKSLQDKLKEHSTELQDVLKKVLEDVQRIEHKRALSRGTSNKYNDKKKTIDTSIDTTEKRREDKSRVEKSKSVTHPPFVNLNIEELEAFNAAYGKPIIAEYIRKINDYIAAIGKQPYKNYAAAMRNWLSRDKIPKIPQVAPNKDIPQEERVTKKQLDDFKNSPTYKKIVGR